MSINEVTLRRARLVPGWVTGPGGGFNSRCRNHISVYNQPPRSTQPGHPCRRLVQLSSSQRAVMPCGCGVKAGMGREWVPGKTVWSPCYHGPYLSALQMRFMVKRIQIDVTSLCFILMCSPMSFMRFSWNLVEYGVYCSVGGVPSRMPAVSDFCHDILMWIFLKESKKSRALFRLPNGRRLYHATIIVSGVCLKRICSLDTSAFSALEVPDDNCAI